MSSDPKTSTEILWNTGCFHFIQKLKEKDEEVNRQLAQIEEVKIDQ